MMPTFEELYAFIKENYRPSRFEERNGKGWGSDYSECIVKSYYEELSKHGKAHVSRHEDIKMHGFSFDRNLVITRGELIEYRNNPGHLTHIF